MLWAAWRCFVATWHQWRVHIGMAAAYYDGIEHSALLACMQMLRIPKRKWNDVFAQVQVLESEARRLRNQVQR